MDILPGILSEEEVLDMPNETLLAFSKLFDSVLYGYIMDYMRADNRKQEVVDKINEAMGDSMDRATFHIQVRERGIPEMIQTNQLQELALAAYSNEVDLSKIIENLEWLKARENRLTTTLPGRTQEEYRTAYELVSEFQRDRLARHHHNIPDIMKKTKTKLFCPPREQAFATGMSSLIVRKNRWQMLLKAAKYLDECMKNNIAYNIMREC